jgi:hypothetical protein
MSNFNASAESLPGRDDGDAQDDNARDGDAYDGDAHDGHGDGNAPASAQPPFLNVPGLHAPGQTTHPPTGPSRASTTPHPTGPSLTVPPKTEYQTPPRPGQTKFMKMLLHQHKIPPIYNWLATLFTVS